MTSNLLSIVGGGMSGFTAAKELRGRGFAGTLTIIDPEGLPYDRPPLSKDLPGRFQDASRNRPGAGNLVRGKQRHRRHRPGSRAGPRQGHADLDDGSVMTADRLCWPPAARPAGWPSRAGTLTRRAGTPHREDADRLRGSWRPGVRLAIVGAGLIGAETASSARRLRRGVTLIDPVESPLVPASARSWPRACTPCIPTPGPHVTGIPEEITRRRRGYRIAAVRRGTIDGGRWCWSASASSRSRRWRARPAWTPTTACWSTNTSASLHPAVYAVGDSAPHPAGRRHAAAPRRTLGARHERGPRRPPRSWPGPAGARRILVLVDRHGVHVEGVGSMHGEGEHVAVRDAGRRPDRGLPPRRRRA